MSISDSAFANLRGCAAERYVTDQISAAVGARLGLTALLVVPLLELHAAGRIHHSLRHRHCLLSISLQSELSHFQERFLDRCTIDSASLVEKHVIVFSGPLLASGGRNLPISLLIELVAKADEGEGLGVLRARILIETISPSGKSIERLLVGDVVAECATIGTAIEGVAE